MQCYGGFHMLLLSQIISDLQGTIDIYGEDFNVIAVYSHHNNRITGFCDASCDSTFGKSASKSYAHYHFQLLKDGQMFINQTKIELMPAKTLLTLLCEQQNINSVR